MNPVDPAITRRAALAAAGAVGVAAALAACGSSASPAASRSLAGGGTAPARGSSDPARSDPARAALATLDNIPLGQAVSAQLNGAPVVVARPSPDSAACFSAICTHLGCTVAPAGKQLRCPCHGSVYDASTGKVLSGPAPKPLPRIPVQVRGGEVVSA